MKNLLLVCVSFCMFLIACGKKTDNPVDTTPTNLTFNATVAADNSGNVSFVASATNATAYDFDFGNGIFTSSNTGSLSYKYFSTGSYTVTVYAKNAGGQSISKSITINVNVVLALVWADEFNTPGLPDATKWGYDLGAGGWGNQELENYTSRVENAVVSGGTLKINLIKENYGGSPYTSARMLTKDKFSFKYGRIEVRAKLPVGLGTWPAIWMLGGNISNTPWPACGEIDIMEHRESELNKIFGTLHYPGHSGANGSGGYTLTTNATSEFHVYSCEWSDGNIKIAVDGNSYFSLPNNSGLPLTKAFL